MGKLAVLLILLCGCGDGITSPDLDCHTETRRKRPVPLWHKAVPDPEGTEQTVICTQNPQKNLAQKIWGK